MFFFSKQYSVLTVKKYHNFNIFPPKCETFNIPSLQGVGSQFSVIKVNQKPQLRLLESLVDADVPLNPPHLTVCGADSWAQICSDEELELLSWCWGDAGRFLLSEKAGHPEKQKPAMSTFWFNLHSITFQTDHSWTKSFCLCLSIPRHRRHTSPIYRLSLMIRDGAAVTRSTPPQRLKRSLCLVKTLTTVM